MANSWKKIFKKLDKSPVDGPFPSDWEAMNAKIAAHHELRSGQRKRGLWWGAGLAIVLVVATALGLLMWWPQEDAGAGNVAGTETSPAQESSQQEIHEVSHNEETQVADDQNSAPSELGQKTNNREDADEEAGPETIAESFPQETSKHSPQKDAEALVGDRGQDADENFEPEDAQASEKTEPASAPGNIAGSEHGKEDLSTGESAPGNMETPVGEMESGTPADNEPKEPAQDFTHQEQTDIQARALDEVIAGLEQPAGEDAASVTAPEFMDLTAKGFKVTGISVGAKVLTDFSPDFRAFGQGVDIDIQRGGLLFNTGFHYFEAHSSHSFENIFESTSIDTSFITHTETHVHQRVDSIWVIQGPYQGGFVYDTTEFTVVDSIVETRIDSTSSRISARQNQRIRLSYVEMPVLVGHRFRFNRFAIDVMGGVAINKVTSTNSESTEIKTDFGMDALFQPSVRYFFFPRWSAFGRAGMRYGLISGGPRSKGLYGDFQLGLSFHW